MTRLNRGLAWFTMAIVGIAALTVSCAGQAGKQDKELMTVGNPFMPLWEHIPDGEPYVFEDHLNNNTSLPIDLPTFCTNSVSQVDARAVAIGNAVQ